eukprot:1502752-Rhodomonas_salina.4
MRTAYDLLLIWPSRQAIITTHIVIRTVLRDLRPLSVYPDTPTSTSTTACRAIRLGIHMYHDPKVFCYWGCLLLFKAFYICVRLRAHDVGDSQSSIWPSRTWVFLVRRPRERVTWATGHSPILVNRCCFLHRLLLVTSLHPHMRSMTGWKLLPGYCLEFRGTARGWAGVLK